MEKLGSEMVKHCGGLPLAIIVLGGLLLTKKTLREWEKVHQSIKSYLRNGEGVGQDNHGGVLGMLALSYKDLPYQLKPCFLYMGKFFEDSEIETERLYQMWIAESMVKSKDQREGETIMDVAECYLGELAQRCMVQVIENKSQFRRFKSCRLHDLMRDLCLFMSKEEDFFNVVDFRHKNDLGLAEASSSSSSKSKARRLVIYCEREANGNGYVALAKETSKRLRSFLFFNTSERCQPHFFTIVRSYIDDFKMLRVLTIEGLALHDDGDFEMANMVDHYAFPKGICNLIHLRYLSLRRTFLIMFPSSRTNLKPLQTLDLRGTIWCFLPCMATALRKMWRLRHLYLPEDIKKSFKAPKWRLDGLVNLETLEIFDPDWCNIEDLFKLTNLQKLKAKVDEKIEEVEKIVSYLISTNPVHFCHSSLSVTDSSLNREEGHTAIRQLLACGSLHELKFVGFLSENFVGHGHDNNFSFSPSLTKLSLIYSNLREDPMSLLEKFPNLSFLSLKEHTYLGKEFTCSTMGFPQLRYLKLSILFKLEKWTVEKVM